MTRYDNNNSAWTDQPVRRSLRLRPARPAAMVLMLLAVVIVHSTDAGADLVNGDFSSGLTGWQVDGPVSDGGGHAALAEDPTKIMTILSQEFAIPLGAASLKFDFRMASEPDGTGGWPFADAFAVSLLDPVTLAPLLSTPGFPEFSYADADGAMEYDPALVSIAGGTVMLDLTSLGPGNALMAFDLLGGDNGLTTTVEVDNVVLIERQDTIPEPATILGFSCAIASLCGYLRRRRR